MATAYAGAISANGVGAPPAFARSRRRPGAGAQAKPKVKFPAAMLPVAVFLDGLQVVFGVIFSILISIPLIGIVFAVLVYIVNILITICLIMLFAGWLHHAGFGRNLFLRVFLVLMTEVFSSGILPSWTIFVLRMRYLAKRENARANRTAVFRA